MTVAKKIKHLDLCRIPVLGTEPSSVTKPEIFHMLIQCFPLVPSRVSDGRDIVLWLSSGPGQSQASGHWYGDSNSHGLLSEAYYRWFAYIAQISYMFAEERLYWPVQPYTLQNILCWCANYVIPFDHDCFISPDTLYLCINVVHRRCTSRSTPTFMLDICNTWHDQF